MSMCWPAIAARAAPFTPTATLSNSVAGCPTCAPGITHPFSTATTNAPASSPTCAATVTHPFSTTATYASTSPSAIINTIDATTNIAALAHASIFILPSTSTFSNDAKPIASPTVALASSNVGPAPAVSSFIAVRSTASEHGNRTDNVDCHRCPLYHGW